MSKKQRVFLATVTNNDGGGGTPYRAVFSTHRRAVAGLADYCRSQWEAQGHDEELPRGAQGAVDQYFQFWLPEETHEIEELELDPED